jgi:hypothetical protein
MSEMCGEIKLMGKEKETREEYLREVGGHNCDFGHG